MKIELTLENILHIEHALNLVIGGIDWEPDKMTDLYEMEMEPEDIDLKVIRKKAHSALENICKNLKQSE